MTRRARGGKQLLYAREVVVRLRRHEDVPRYARRQRIGLDDFDDQSDAARRAFVDRRL